MNNAGIHRLMRAYIGAAAGINAAAGMRRGAELFDCYAGMPCVQCNEGMRI